MIGDRKHILVLGLSLALAGCWGGHKDISGDIAEAEQLLKSGNAPKARVELENALKKSPFDPRANLLIARIEDKDGDLDSAVPHYLRAARPDAHLLEPQLRVVEILIDSKRLREALGLINSAVGAFPDSMDAVALRAMVEEALDQVGPARTDADAVLQRDPTNPRALATLATLYLRDRNGSAALDSVNRGLARDPANIRLLQVRAAALLTLDQPDKAAEALRTIIRASPRNVTAQRVLANIETRDGHYAEAEAQFRSAVEADPSNEAMQLAFIEFLSGQKKDQDLVAYLNGLIQRHPDSATYDLILAEYYRTHDDVQTSSDVVARAVARLGNSAAGLATRVALAKLKASAGRPGEAEAVVGDVLAIDPTNKEALAFRATLEIEAGRNGNAIADLLAVLRQDAVNAAAYQNLATAYLNSGQPAQAIDAMRRAVALTPEDASAQIKLAAFLQRGGDFNGAREIAAREVLQHPDSPAIWVASARLALDRKDWDAASRAVARLRQLPDAGSAADLVQASLNLAKGDGKAAFALFATVLQTGDAVDPPAITAFGQASLLAGDPAGGARVLGERMPTLRGDVLKSALQTDITLQAQAGNIAGAQKDFEKLLALEPQTIDPYSAYVAALVDQHRFDEAQQVVKGGFLAGAPKWSLLLLQASLHEMTGNGRTAVEEYRQALDSNPASLAAANNYASLLADLSPKDTARLQAARDRFNGLEGTSNASLADTIAWLDYRLGRLEEAKVLLTRTKAAANPSPQIRFHLAAVLMAAGDRPGGLALLDTVKGMTFPGSDEARTLSAS